MFLVALRKRGVVWYACKAVGVPRRTVYDWRESDEKFRKAWDEAVDDAIDTMEAEAYRRATKGTLKPVYQQGACVGQIREYSDTLLIFMLKAKRPNQFRDTGTANMPPVDASVSGGGLTVTFTPPPGVVHASSSTDEDPT